MAVIDTVSPGFRYTSDFWFRRTYQGNFEASRSWKELPEEDVAAFNREAVITQVQECVNRLWSS